MKTIKNIQYQYIDASELVNEVKNELSTYFNQGTLDESYLYPGIRRCLGKMGLKIYPSKTAVLTVDDYKAKLPVDFYKLQIALGCFQVTTSDIDVTQSKYEEVRYETLPDDTCTYEVCSDTCGYFSIQQKFDTFTNIYTTTGVLNVSQDARPYCTNECFAYNDYKKQDEITIKNGKIYTSFTSGQVYIEYLSNLETEEGDLMIPDNQTIRQWIKDEITLDCFKYLYLNNISDVQQRVSYLESKLAQSQLNARAVFTRSEFSEFYDFRKVFYSRFHKFNTSVYGKYYAYPVNARSFHDKVTGLR